MATNRPQDLDEAMFRRIRCVFELTSPHHAQRLQVWRRLTSAAGIVIQVAENPLRGTLGVVAGCPQSRLALLLCVARCKYPESCTTEICVHI